MKNVNKNKKLASFWVMEWYHAHTDEWLPVEGNATLRYMQAHIRFKRIAHKPNKFRIVRYIRYEAQST